MKEVLVFTATYNEADNIPALVSAVFAALPRSEMLVVDDNSPDGTGDVLDRIAAGEPRLHVIHRPGKNGLGTAHKAGMKYALEHGYETLVTMDADFSHDPAVLPEMMRQLEQAEFVIGSRYVAGGSCEYPLSRVVLSTVANWLTRATLSIPVHETTTAYRGYRRSLLERMDIDAIRSEGYSYFVEAIYQVHRLTRNNSGQNPRTGSEPPAMRSDGQSPSSRDAHQGLQGMAEFPIRFADRRAGSSKISKKEIWKGFSTLFRLGVERALGRTDTTSRAPAPGNRA
jgi:dolichol-phosphate mannosyltransferase